MLPNKLVNNKRMHPYAHALRRQREHFHEVALANTLPPPQTIEVARERNEEKFDRRLDHALIMSFLRFCKTRKSLYFRNTSAPHLNKQIIVTFIAVLAVGAPESIIANV
ncbi:hypothetical protein F5876DRAFT_71770 [Lentinula aff. lateritia]|uniref:Uncharacterized protein n=1 Tax=Lentinula aff. lateritia TaxID=2804960 RepID=A0ACC1UG14_9AGAR|nr:hypothetical protein F5876DRAFT_71770 [Lentinula aff. lateritia]